MPAAEVLLANQNRLLSTPDVHARITPCIAHTIVSGSYACSDAAYLPSGRYIESTHNIYMVLKKHVKSFRHSCFPCGQVCTVLICSLYGALFWQTL